MNNRRFRRGLKRFLLQEITHNAMVRVADLLFPAVMICLYRYLNISPGIPQN